MKRIICSLLLVLAVFGQTSDDDFVDFTIPNYTHNWYSGYLNITTEKDLHYIYLQSQNDKDNDPLILWLGGGPGCSALNSMLYETGPFRYLTPLDPNLNVTNTSWNMRANLLYIDAAGVGFSRGPSTSSDDDLAFDASLALSYFFQRFPTQKKNDFYIAGHGYAGISGMLLANLIDQRNTNPFYTKINLKGILLGNPCTLYQECWVGKDLMPSYHHYQHLYHHAFLNDNHWNIFKGACMMNYTTNPICKTQREALDKIFNSTNSSTINIYAKCYKGQGQIPNAACEDEYGINHFMNDPNIQEKLHVTPMNFTICNNDLRGNFVANNGSYWLYKELIAKKKYKIFIYSGDLDSHVPTLSTKTWVQQLKEDIDIPVRRTWNEWWVPGVHPHEDQVGGMVWELEGLTLATVKGAGMAVGRDKSVGLYEIVTAFLTGKRLPYITSQQKQEMK